MKAAIRRILLAAAGILSSVALQLGAQSASSLCTSVITSPGTGSGLSTFGGGTVALGINDPGGRCALSFENFSGINVGSSLFTAQGSGSTSTYCKNAAGARMAATGTNVSHLSLPTFQTTSSTYDFKLINSSQVQLGNNGSTWANRSGSATTITADGRTFTLAAQNNEVSIPAGAAYRTLDMENGERLALTAASGTPTTLIQNLTLAGCNSKGGLTVAPGDYYIENLSIQAGCRISVSGSSGRVNFYVKNGFTINGGPTCINFPVDASYSCKTYSTSAADATRFALMVYSGTLSTQGDISMAGAFYADGGDFNAGNGGLYRIVGEVVAANITMLGNDGTIVSYQNTGVFSASSNLRNGEYALAPPAVPASAAAGDLAYLPSQRDLDSSGNPAYSGTIYAHALNADGSLVSTATWDATAAMTATDRAAKFWTHTSTSPPALVLLGNVDDAAFGTYSPVASELRQAIPNPRALSDKYLAGRDPARLVGRLHRTAPVIAGAVVVFATEEGVLYAIDKSTGALKWGYIPRSVLPLTGNPAQMISTAVWGQLSYLTSGSSGYVTGSVLQGQEHLSLKIDPATGALQAIAFIDNVAGATGPTTPYGGDAPIPAQTTDSTGNVYYVVGNTLKQRPVDGTGSVTSKALSGATVSSALVPVDPTHVYFGATDGKVYQVSTADTSAPAALYTVAAGQPVIGLSGLAYASSAGSQTVLAGNSDSTLAVHGTTYTAPTWNTTIGSSSSATVPTLPTGARLTGGTTLTSDAKLLLPVTVGTSCREQAYVLGPLDLDTGAMTSNAKMRQTGLSAALNLVGDGTALAARTTTIGTRRFGIANSGGGSGSTGASRDATRQWAEMEWGRKTYRVKVRNWREVTRDLP